MTLDQFCDKLKALLREAEASGLDRDDFCALTEDIIAIGWKEESDE